MRQQGHAASLKVRCDKSRYSFGFRFAPTLSQAPNKLANCTWRSFNDSSACETQRFKARCVEMVAKHPSKPLNARRVCTTRPALAATMTLTALLHRCSLPPACTRSACTPQDLSASRAASLEVNEQLPLEDVAAALPNLEHLDISGSRLPAVSLRSYNLGSCMTNLQVRCRGRASAACGLLHAGRCMRVHAAPALHGCCSPAGSRGSRRGSASMMFWGRGSFWCAELAAVYGSPGMALSAAARLAPTLHLAWQRRAVSDHRHHHQSFPPLGATGPLHLRVWPVRPGRHRGAAAAAAPVCCRQPGVGPGSLAG